MSEDGSTDKFKARPEAKGFTHIEGIDYEETLSLVVRFVSIHRLLALIAHLNLKIFKRT